MGIYRWGVSAWHPHVPYKHPHYLYRFKDNTLSIVTVIMLILLKITILATAIDNLGHSVSRPRDMCLYVYQYLYTESEINLNSTLLTKAAMEVKIGILFR